MSRMPFKVPLDQPVNRLAAGEKQKLEILKQLYLGGRFLILDEPTSVLTPDEASVQTLLDIVSNRLAVPEPRPTILLSRAPKLVFKTNKKGTKGKLTVNVKVETDIGARTYKGSLKAALKGVTGGS